MFKNWRSSANVSVKMVKKSRFCTVYKQYGVPFHLTLLICIFSRRFSSQPLKFCTDILLVTMSENLSFSIFGCSTDICGPSRPKPSRNTKDTRYLMKQRDAEVAKWSTDGLCVQNFMVYLNKPIEVRKNRTDYVST